MDGACGSCTAGDYSVPCGTYGTCQFENTHDPDYNCHCP